MKRYWKSITGAVVLTTIAALVFWPMPGIYLGYEPITILISEDGWTATEVETSNCRYFHPQHGIYYLTSPPIGSPPGLYVRFDPTDETWMQFANRETITQRCDISWPWSR